MKMNTPVHTRRAFFRPAPTITTMHGAIQQDAAGDSYRRRLAPAR